MGPEFHSDLYKLPGNLISLWKVLLRLLFALFSAILMTLSPRGWNPRKQKDADSLSDSIKSPVNSPCLNQYPQLLHAELQWKEQHKATSRNLKVFEGKQAEISHKLMVWSDHTTTLFFSFSVLGSAENSPLSLHSLSGSVLWQFILFTFFAISITPNLPRACQRIVGT